MKGLKEIFLNKGGSQMVEASIAMPVVILAVVLLIRLFTFYLQILCTGISEHEKVLEAYKAYDGSEIRVYESVEYVEMLKGGLLGIDVKKTIISRAYFCNEDKSVRKNTEYSE